MVSRAVQDAHDEHLVLTNDIDDGVAAVDPATQALAFEALQQREAFGRGFEPDDGPCGILDDGDRRRFATVRDPFRDVGQVGLRP